MGRSLWLITMPLNIPPDAKSLRSINKPPKSFQLCGSDFIISGGQGSLSAAVLGICLLELIKRVPPSVQRVNFQEDWKVITVQIGGSDFCDFCTDSVTGAGPAQGS